MTRSLFAAACFVCVALPAHALDVRAVVTEVARTVGVPTALMHGVVKTETHYRCHAVGLAGELGVAQVKPATARSVGVHGNLRDCRTGALAGARYLSLALARSGGNWRHAATLYNAGIYSHRRSSAYATKVLRAARFRMAGV